MRRRSTDVLVHASNSISSTGCDVVNCILLWLKSSIYIPGVLLKTTSPSSTLVYRVTSHSRVLQHHDTISLLTNAFTKLVPSSSYSPILRLVLRNFCQQVHFSWQRLEQIRSASQQRRTSRRRERHLQRLRHSQSMQTDPNRAWL